MNRKIDHIEMTALGQTQVGLRDPRFLYEPLLSAHPKKFDHHVTFLGKTMKYPIWISSMTGGIKEGGQINNRLAKLCHQYEIGMGLGSIRKLLEDQSLLDSYHIRPVIGEHLPLMANLGVAQAEKMLRDNTTDQLNQILEKLEVDCLMIHINPLQEWIQKEGDRYLDPPFITISKLYDKVKIPLGIKEVGQGMGPLGLKKLLELPVRVFEFGAFGGTNFTKLEMMRNHLDQGYQEALNAFSKVGHDALSMVQELEKILSDCNQGLFLKEIIISGGINSILDGMYLVDRLRKTTGQKQITVIFGQASRFLEYARISSEALGRYVQGMVDGLDLYRCFLTIDPNWEKKGENR